MKKPSRKQRQPEEIIPEDSAQPPVFSAPSFEQEAPAFEPTPKLEPKAPVIEPPTEKVPRPRKKRLWSGERRKGIFFSIGSLILMVLVLILAPIFLPSAGPQASELLKETTLALTTTQAKRFDFSGQIQINDSGGISGGSHQTSAGFEGSVNGSDFQLKTDSGLEMRKVGTNFYYLNNDSSWISFPLSSLSHTLGKVGGAKQVLEPSSILPQMLTSLGSLDGSSLDGPTLDNQSTWDIKPLLLGSSILSSTHLPKEVQDKLLGQLQVHIFVGRSDHLPRRLSFSIAIPSADLGENNPLQIYVEEISLSATVDFSNYGTAQPIAAPAHAVSQAPLLEGIAKDGLNPDAATALVGALG